MNQYVCEAIGGFRFYEKRKCYKTIDIIISAKIYEILFEKLIFFSSPFSFLINENDEFARNKLASIVVLHPHTTINKSRGNNHGYYHDNCKMGKSFSR